MRQDELKKYIKIKRKLAKNLEATIFWCLKVAREAELELNARPKTKKYGAGVYWGNTAYFTSGEWIESKEELIIVDNQLHPWLWEGTSWRRFDQNLNQTSIRTWQKISDL